jgi:hypothetical protein
LKFYWNKLPDILNTKINNLFNSKSWANFYNKEILENMVNTEKIDYSYIEDIDNILKIVEKTTFDE